MDGWVYSFLMPLWLLAALRLHPPPPSAAAAVAAAAWFWNMLLSAVADLLSKNQRSSSSIFGFWLLAKDGMGGGLIFGFFGFWVLGHRSC